MPRLPTFAPDCHILLDGEPVPARRGEPVAAALLAAGKPLVSRSAKYHRPRGAFCLAGACGTCLVRADGLPNQRACRTPCRDGLAIDTQNAVPGARHDLLGVIDVVYARGLDHHHLMTWSRLANRATVAISRRLAGLGRLPDPAAVAAERAAGPVDEERFDALVVGAGPAGLAAAERLAEAGLRALLVDHEPRLGGRLRCRLDLPGEPDLDFAARAAARVTAAGGEVLLGTAVLGLWRDGGSPLAALHGDGPPPRLRLVRAARLLICTGGTPQPPAIADGDRPGVYGGRGLAAGLAEHGVVPGSRAAVLGAGPEADAVAARLASGGMEIERVRDPGGVRVLGRGRVKGLAVPGTGRVRCDTVAVATPPAPAAELARELGAPVVWDPALAAFALEVSPDGETGVPGLFAAGEVTGEMDGAVAADAGRRAGEKARG